MRIGNFEKDIRNVSFMAWNVNGLSRKKLHDKDFVRQIKEYQIVCLSETWTKSNSDISIGGFSNFHIPSISRRGKKRGRNSGGVIVYVSNKIVEGVAFVRRNKTTLWLQLDANYFGWEDNIYLANTYCPPESSVYYDNHLEQLELDIVDFMSSGKVVIMGDLNARTGGEADFIVDDEIDNFVPLPHNYSVDGKITKRSFCDYNLNNSGKRLLDTCISNNMRIMNGRFVGDSIGRFTYYSILGASTIDYGICHKSVLNLIRYFIVLPLTEYSDHCQISFAMTCRPKQHSNDRYISKNKYDKIPLKISPKWKDWSKQVYTDTLWHDSNITKLITFMNKSYMLNTESANEAAKDLTEFILQVSEAATEFVEPRINSKRVTKNKLGYDLECLNLRKTVRQHAKRLHRSPTNAHIKQEFLKYKRQYQKLVKRKERNCRKEIIDNLELLHTKDHKSYWNLIGKLKNSHNSNNSTIEPAADQLIEHYINLNKINTNNAQEHIQVVEDNVSLEKTSPPVKELDKPFTINEIKKGITNLKRNKASGPDQILNEFLIYGKDALCAPISKLFNLCLRSHCFPENWSEGCITSIFKSGEQTDPNNYRGITILSCLGKLFTSILNERLFNFLIKHKLLNKWQAGFIPDHRTSDQTFILKSLVHKYIHQSKKKLYVCFVDFRKAFDLVWQEGLLNKLLKLNIGGDFYFTIKNIYKNSHVRVKTSEGLSHRIKTNNGVRQGDCISPLLFNIFINDLPEIFLDNSSKPPILDKEYIPALLYADDLIIISETEEGLQNSLNLLHDYCKKWKLEVNLSKTNVIPMGKGKIPLATKFRIGVEEIKITNTYKYLGTIINSNGSFTHAKKDLKQKGMKALFSIWKSISPGNRPPVNLACKLFDTMVKPIILYNSDVWGSEFPSTIQNLIQNGEAVPDDKYLKFINDCPFEKLHLKFCKMLLGVKKNASNIACRAELARYPLIIEIYISIIKYWMRLISLPKNRVVVDALNMNMKMQEAGQYSWTSLVKFILQSAGLNEIWVKKEFNNPRQILHTLRQNLHNRYNEVFLRSIHNDSRENEKQSNKLRTYRTVKVNHVKERYLTEIKNPEIRAAVSKLRLSSHGLMIEKGRHLRLDIKDRICKNCNSKDVEDEFHVVMLCSKYEAERKTLFGTFEEEIHNWHSLSSKEKFLLIFKMESNLIETGKFFLHILSNINNQIVCL